MEDSYMSDANKGEKAVEAEEKQPESTAESALEEAAVTDAGKPAKASGKTAEEDQPAPEPETAEAKSEGKGPEGEDTPIEETDKEAAMEQPAAEYKTEGKSEPPEDDSEARDDGRRGRPYPRDDGESRPRRPGGGGRGRYRSFYKRKYCKFCSKKADVSYRDADTLRRFITDRGKILPRRITGTCPKHQRQLSVAIKQARILALLPFVEK
jgi:small subunit ribosomal protein S18